MTVQEVETCWLKFLLLYLFCLTFFLLRCAYLKSHCSGAMETPETTHEKIGTYMSADCFFALHQFFFILMHQMIVSLPSIVYNDKYFEI